MTMKFADGTRARTTDELIAWYGEWCATKTLDSIPHTGEDSITVSGSRLTHYGHFPLAECIRESNGTTRLVILNGDSYGGSGGWGPSTSSRQGSARRAMERNGVPHVTIPFSALEGAGIDHRSIKVLAQRDDRRTFHELSSKVRPGRFEDRESTDPVWPSRSGMEHAYVESEAQLGDDGLWRWTVKRHWLGDSVIRAASHGYVRQSDGGTSYKTTWGNYLSSFDYNESRPLYFLCELPRNLRISELQSVDAAIEALKPPEVVNAIDSGLDVIRQGDVFAIPTSYTTRELTKRAETFEVRHWGTDDAGQSVPVVTLEAMRKGAHVLGTNHTATNVIVAEDGDTFARGIMRHAPGNWRDPDHAAVTLGDRKAWYRLVKNTVPVATGRRTANQRGQARAWTSTGTVD